MGVFHAGPTFTFTVFDPAAGMTTSASTLSYKAGSAPVTVYGDMGVSNANVPVTFYTAATGTFSGSGVTCATGSTTLCTAYTNSTGVAKASFQPSNTAGTSSQVYTLIGNSPYCIDKQVAFPACGSKQYWADNSVTIGTVAGTPSEVSISLPGNGTSTAPNSYITTSGTDVKSNAGAMLSGAYPYAINVSLSDKFSNPVSFAAGDTLSISTTNGRFSNATLGKTVTSFTVMPAATTFYTIPLPYFQSSTYGTVSTIVAALTRSSTTFSGNSGQLITSTFDASTHYTNVTLSTGHFADSTHFKQGVGTQVTVWYNLTSTQKGVPVQLYLDNTTSTQTNGDGAFSNGAQSTMATTNASGIATASFTLDTGSNSVLYFVANVTAPTNGAATGALGLGTDSQNITTTPGLPTIMVVNTYFDSALTEPTKYVANTAGSVLYVNVALADKYGNPASDNLGYQLQITLSAPGSLSVSSAYIKKGAADTNSSFGPILWTTPTTLGSATLTATSSLGTATKTVTVVLPTPTIYVNSVNSSPLVSGSTFYVSSTFVSISGNASVSKGYPSTENITSVCYTMGSGASACPSIVVANTATFSTTVSLASGLNTITFNATDTQSNHVTSSTFTILVDTGAPQVNFVTANNANVSSPATVSAKIVDSMGDLNATSVSAMATNTDTLATKTATATLTGSNNPGHSVSYGVTISGLATGNWSITLSASDLAGNSNSSTITVHVTVPFAESFVISGTPSATTVGSFAGISASYTNLNPTPQSVVVFAVFKNSAGQTMGIGTGSVTVNAGATQAVFIADPVGLASGTYTVNIFVFTTGNLPVSAQTTISVTV